MEKVGDDNLDAASGRLSEVESALERIEEGSYGVCDRCGEEIRDEELDADPLARLCGRCRPLPAAPGGSGGDD